jgi:hypothetical protein
MAVKAGLVVIRPGMVCSGGLGMVRCGSVGFGLSGRSRRGKLRCGQEWFGSAVKARYVWALRG